jgi:nickel/cobalt transporter (NicO) family protein
MNLRGPLAGGAVLTSAVAICLLSAAPAQAHPLGNFTVNRYDGLVVTQSGLRVDHVEDLAEIPAAQAKPEVDRNSDGRMARAELAAWAKPRCRAAADGARATVDGQPVPLAAGSASAVVRPGQAGLPTLRVECRLTTTAALPKSARAALTYRPADIGTGPGWREITARGDRMTLAASDVRQASVSHRLTSYPRGLLSSPANERSATLRATQGGAALASDGDDASSGAASVLPRGADRWTQALTGLVARHALTPGFAALALGIAMALGAMHALAPGHGKTMMAAAAAAGGHRSRRDIFALGASVTITHTLGVFALGALVTAGSAAAPSVISWLGIASGALVAFAGANLLRRALRGRRQQHHHHHGHSHDHGHGTGHDHGHSHTDDHDHSHTPGHGHDHDHTHDHDHSHTDDHDHDHSHSHTDDHSHSQHSHSHLPVRPSLRGSILLGFAGGMVPSPSAVVVLVGAAALGQAWFGLLLVVAYGAGLAVTLTAAGFAVIRLGHQVTTRLARRDRGRLLSAAHRMAPVGTAAVVLALGCGLMLRGAATTLG